MPTIPPAQFREVSYEEFGTLVVADPERALRILKFYEEHGEPLTACALDPVRVAAKEIINDIEGCLFQAAQIAIQPLPGVIDSTLAKIESQPERLKEAPGNIHYIVASHYRRGDEEAATYWADLFDSAPEGYAHSIEKPTDQNISRAAASARSTLGRPKSRPRLEHQYLLAERLGRLFLQFNKNHGRTVERDNGKSLTRGRFADFLSAVLPSLDAFLKAQKKAPITRDSIVALAEKSLRS